jgi:hypothetical protein
MKKNERLQTWLDQWEPAADFALPKEYSAYFELFNAGDYYEAHDVLEHLWLQCVDCNRSFYQALIQFAGAFVHLQKHVQFPGHPTHSRRLAPAARLFALSDMRLAQYPEFHLHLDVTEVRRLCGLWSRYALGDAPLATETPRENGRSPLTVYRAPVLALR